MKLVVRFAIAALLVAIGIWFVNATEWIEIDKPDPPKGEAAKDPLYAARKLLANFGMHVEARTALDALPPKGARLLLASSDWDLFPERARRLREWVQSGGHLVVPPHVLQRTLLDWVPVTTRERPAPAPRSSQPPKPVVDAQGCFDATDGERKLHLCGWPHWENISARDGTVPTWRLQGPQGIEGLRVPFGAGSVTVTGPSDAFDNENVLRADNPLLFAAAMQAERGASAWIVSEESRERLVPWVWHEGWIAVLLVAGAIAAGLWRSAVRFGPVALPRHAERRSMAEQVSGTARFLRRWGVRALHEAQLRALHETASRHVAGYAQADERTRIAKLAERTGLAASQLADAMRGGNDSRKGAAQLQVMETARRRIEDGRYANQE